MRFVFNYPETSGLESDLLDSGEISDVAVAVKPPASTPSRSPSTRSRVPTGCARRPPDPRPVRRPRVRGRGHRAHQAADPPVGRAVPQPLPPGQDRATLDRCSQGRFVLGLGRATTRPSSSPSASTSTNAMRCSTRRWRSCRRRGRASPSTPMACTSLPRASSSVRVLAEPDPDLDRWQLQAQSSPRRDRAGVDADGDPRRGRPHHTLAAHRRVSAARRDDRRGEGHGRRSCR